MRDHLLADLGLTAGRGWLRDPWFHAAALAALPVTLGLRAAFGAFPDDPGRDIVLLLSFLLWQPLIEELLFRGLIQGQLRATRFGAGQHAGISGANLITAVLFAAAHGLHHSSAWAAAVFVPALIFGFMRDRHGHIYPGLVLHCGYNGLYLLAGLG